MLPSSLAFYHYSQDPQIAQYKLLSASLAKEMKANVFQLFEIKSLHLKLLG